MGRLDVSNRVMAGVDSREKEVRAKMSCQVRREGGVRTRKRSEVRSVV